MGRTATVLTLTDDERSELRGWARRPSTAQPHALRARIILACAEGANNSEVAQQLEVTRQTVGTWSRRFVERRLDGLVDAPRPGAPCTIRDEDVGRVIATALEQTPKDATHWTDMPAQTGPSSGTVYQSWTKGGRSRRSAAGPVSDGVSRPRTGWQIQQEAKTVADSSRTEVPHIYHSCRRCRI